LDNKQQRRARHAFVLYGQGINDVIVTKNNNVTADIANNIPNHNATIACFSNASNSFFIPKQPFSFVWLR